MSGFAWAPHVCRVCGARLAAEGEGGEARFSCGNCDLSCTGAPDGICGCGISLGRGRPKPGAPRFRCAPNPERGIASPAAFVICYGDTPL